MKQFVSFKPLEQLEESRRNKR